MSPVTRLAEALMLSHGWRRFLILYVAGAVAALSAAPLFILPALLVAMPFWVWALDGAEPGRGIVDRLFGPAFAIGFAFGWGYFTVTFHWLGAAFFIEGGLYLLLMPPAILALAALIGLFWGLGSALAHAFWSNGPWRIATLATALGAAEYARGTFFTGFPFDLLGYALTGTDEMVQAASLVGIYGLTLIAALIGFAPALVWPADGRTLTRRFVPVCLALGLVALQLGWGNVRLSSTALAERDDLRLRLVQPMVLEHVDWSLADPATVMDRLIGLTETRTGPDDPGLSGVTHVIWPESVFPFFLGQYPDALARIGRMLPENALLLTGAPRADYATGTDNPGYNALLAIDTNGEIVARYDKSHLVPFGEYLPFADLFGLFGIRQFVPGTEGWAPGDGRRLVAAPGTPAFIALICYEAIFSGQLGADPRDAQWILNITNDAWFDGSIGPEKHAHHARIRAVEAGLPMVRVGNSGITFLSDPLGRITARLAPEEMALMDVVPTQKLETTLFNRLWHWPFFFALGVGALLSIGASRRPRKALA
ncbi:apolipoprotein N-acyltransferase [Arsenicitalea aurantiaca]|uniref:Apolipoprotein N-acyltransferase n=1 Tax=Arsenicitalea aurantiaca TaxID=1783274 RepID=A0A433X828_9HYPH|nr:apolipoprotein N-acyltransferase [Arsenicitalea aurantiaca]RUT30203.1 apolipoprotein N-acyltransferase [Arsenicitalea aurantiaca]